MKRKPQKAPATETCIYAKGPTEETYKRDQPNLPVAPELLDQACRNDKSVKTHPHI